MTKEYLIPKVVKTLDGIIDKRVPKGLVVNTDNIDNIIASIRRSIDLVNSKQ